ncbi:hypothetical protein EVAR_5060_1 [Eumeta japonica]|uniref:Uncharacterized protein n=1 Tax=Eumeta variegata TaxID=151549 RepID=A0A4C1SU15_EUMVA|nr:hypothetical protein EVAR_5060_1 [Eumeta japonica]
MQLHAAFSHVHSHRPVSALIGRATALRSYRALRARRIVSARRFQLRPCRVAIREPHAPPYSDFVSTKRNRSREGPGQRTVQSSCRGIPRSALQEHLATAGHSRGCHDGQ